MASERGEFAERLLQLVLHPVQLEALTLQHPGQRPIALAALSELSEEIRDAFFGSHIAVESRQSNPGNRPDQTPPNNDRRSSALDHRPFFRVVRVPQPPRRAQVLQTGSIPSRIIASVPESTSTRVAPLGTGGSWKVPRSSRR